MSSSTAPDLGPNVIGFDPSMPVSRIQATVDTVAGLGASPSDVTINGHVDVYNQCDEDGCRALSTATVRQ